MTRTTRWPSCGWACRQLTGGVEDDKIYVYYGNRNPPLPAGRMPPGTYDVAQALVLQLLVEASGPPQDSTAYKNNRSSSTAEAVPASPDWRRCEVLRHTEPSRCLQRRSLRLLPNQGITPVGVDKARPSRSRRRT